ncbi:MAG: cellulase family glycosylhydrolase, partial [Janthinobacterium lividum]
LAFGLLCAAGTPYFAYAAGTDSLTVNVSEDAYLGNAVFTVSVDKKKIGGNLTASALRNAGESQDFTLSGSWGAGPHTVTVRYLQDAYGGSSSKDRNLYVNRITYDNIASAKINTEIGSAGSVDFSIAAVKAASVSLSMEPGVNLSGLEMASGKKPGVANVDYAVPTTSELDYYASKGVKVVRLPILWERLQPGLLSASPTLALDTKYLGYITKLMTYASTKGMGVIVDLHNYGAYNAIKMASSAGVGGPLFGAAWTTIAGALKSNPGLLGYDLMNEPNGFPAHGIWQSLAQYGINGVRAADTNTLIVVEGDAWASAGSWNTQSVTMNALRDPAQKMMFEAHVYGDRDSSGTHFAWATEAALGVTVNTIAQRVAVFGAWCRTNAVQCMVGEVGVGNDSPNWNTELLNGLAQMKADGMVAVTYWAGGPWWGTYPMSVEPLNGKDRAQMTVLSAFVN